ncbi:MAG: hypothetical protein ACD_46C00521G0004 [uncultured bacterium]|nr:MAG: hypothetical protein ACD_46C00521G0004 [uncultured bacterium]
MKTGMKMQVTNNFTIKELTELCSTRLEKIFNHYLQDTPALLLKASMQYTLLNSGKHLRPLLIYATGAIFDAPFENLDIPAAAIEMIHTYSLIHDDLPCMDNADLRRGKPACHKVYGDGMAVLTGDALHTLAMQVISTHPAPLTHEKRIQMIATLCRACGSFGMAAGQALDITVMNNENTISEKLLTEIYQLKTGALFSACIELGRIASNNDDLIHQKSLKEFGDCIGFAFQIQDDVLDSEAETAVIGKPQGIDKHKMTYPKLFGINEAKQKVQSLYQQGLEAIDYLGHSAELLRELARHMLDRKR